MLLAVMDLGSNSFKMTVAQWAPELSRLRPFRVLHKERHAIQLGASVFLSGKISPKDRREALKALAKMQARLRDFSSPVLRVVATSAIREATNGREFLREVRSRLGLPLEIISGPEEARLIAQGLEWEYRKIRRGLFIDIGGGSSEVATFGPGWNGHAFAQSFRIGSVRLATQFFTKKSKMDLDKARAYLKNLWRMPPPQRVEKLIGSAGTIQSLGKIFKTSRGTTVIRKRALDQWILATCKKTPTWIAKQYDIAPSRARIVVPGALVLSELMTWLKLNEITVTEMTLRDGMMVDLVKNWQNDKRVMSENVDVKIGARRSEEKTLLRFLEVSANRFQVDLGHARHMAVLALSLFDQMIKAGVALSSEERRYLLVAAYLHDCGKIVSEAAHHKHSAYIIRHLPIPGMNPLEWKKCALIALYHRKETPPKRNPLPGDVAGVHAEHVRRMTALLRLVDGLDEDRTQKVESFQLRLSKKQALLELQQRSSDALDMDYFREKFSYFEELFGVKVVSFVRPRAAGKPIPIH